MFGSVEEWRTYFAQRATFPVQTLRLSCVGGHDHEAKAEKYLDSDPESPESCALEDSEAVVAAIQLGPEPTGHAHESESQLTTKAQKRKTLKKRVNAPRNWVCRLCGAEGDNGGLSNHMKRFHKRQPGRGRGRPPISRGHDYDGQNLNVPKPDAAKKSKQMTSTEANFTCPLPGDKIQALLERIRAKQLAADPSSSTSQSTSSSTTGLIRF